MNEIKIQQATIEDMPEIQRLAQIHFTEAKEEFDNHYDANWPYTKDGEKYYEDEIKLDRHATFLALKNNEIIGYLTASTRIDSKFSNLKIAELDSMFILSEYRSQGIGSKLANAFFDWAKENSAKRLIVQTFSDSDAIRFYEKNGFKDYGAELKNDL